MSSKIVIDEPWSKSNSLQVSTAVASNALNL